MKREILTLTAALACTALLQAASELSYSPAQNEKYMSWGDGKKQSYDVGVGITDPALVGTKIKSISIPVCNREMDTDYSMWMSTELTHDSDRVFHPTLLQKAVEPVSREGYWYVEMTLDEPYEITEGGVYVGYSMKTTEDDFYNYPIIVVEGYVQDGLWAHSSITYRTWKDYSMTRGYVIPAMLTLEGDFQANAAGMVSVGKLGAQAGFPTVSRIVVANHGYNAIKTMEYEVEVDGKTTTGNVTMTPELDAIFGRTAQVEINVPALETGVYDYKVTVTKVNGEANTDPAASGTGVLNVMEQLQCKRSVVEEFTGLWCGWCVRGYVAMEKMAELYDDFIPIVYHNSDEMAIQQYPNMVTGLPGAWLDRKTQLDPYYGTSNEDMGIETAWKAAMEEDATGFINLNAYFSKDDEITVESEVFWADSPAIPGEYRIAYVLLADGLYKGSWKQTNYYYDNPQRPTTPPKYLEDFYPDGQYGYSYVPGLTFNHVAVDASDNRGVEGSITTTEKGERVTHTYKFDISNNGIIQDKGKLKVVGMIVLNDANYGGTYGLVVNANKCLVSDPSSVGELSGDAVREVSVSYYDLGGRRIADPQAGSGVVIRKAELSDGRVRATKMMK